MDQEEHQTMALDGGQDAKEKHKLAERERRKSMRELFLNLHALLPHASNIRKEQSAILDDIIKYIPLAQARLRTLQTRRRASPPAIQMLPSSSTEDPDCNIRVAPDPASPAVSVRIRGDRVTVSIADTKGSSASHTILLSAILEQLESYDLDVVCITHCRDGNKLLHHSECKIVDGSGVSPCWLKTRLQDLASCLHQLRKSPALPSSASSSNLKRSFDQI